MTHLEAADSALRRERRRLVDEREAFAAFARRVADLPTDGAPETGPLVLDTRPVASAAAVRDAYETTVMAVPHYDEDYGDSYEESLAAEFGPELASGLTDGGLTETVKRGLVTAVRESHRERGRLIATVDAERESLAETVARAERVLDELAEYTGEFTEKRYGTLEAYRARLQVLEGKLDGWARDRQAEIRDRHSDLGLREDFPDVQTYCYQDLAVAHPLLATYAELADRCRERRRAVERAYSRVS
ncbi:DUF7260 family protein [Natronomonas sp. EA1]|uniref:DUF7260 family protein n=1 Tax=Natronomonas sp. EA1 TaxID=3421655 RepID=UPI003EB89194